MHSVRLEPTTLMLAGTKFVYYAIGDNDITAKEKIAILLPRVACVHARLDQQGGKVRRAKMAGEKNGGKSPPIYVLEHQGKPICR